MKRNTLSRILGAAALTTALSAQAQSVALPNRADPLDGVTTSGQPDEGSLAKLAESGYTAVIDLRAVDEQRGFDERTVVEALGMTYHALPVKGASDVSFQNADALSRLLSEIDGPVLLHCGSGNRAGALLALRAKLRGADDESALALGRDAGLTGLEPVVRDRLESGP